MDGLSRPHAGSVATRLRSKRWLRVLAAAATAAAVLPSAASAQGSWGQTFFAPSGTNTYLQSITAGQLLGYQSNTYAFNLYAYSGTDAGGSVTGPALFTQSVAGPFTTSVTLTPNVNLTAGQMYALVLSGGGLLGSVGPSTIAGEAVECSGSTCSPLFAQGSDFIGFSATFGATPVTTPEPSSLALLGTGLAGLVPMIRRRRTLS